MVAGSRGAWSPDTGGSPQTEEPGVKASEAVASKLEPGTRAECVP